ncbi:MAG: hypothetical protein FWF36_07195 [Propionibacteriaceae bacterium]|nr:hypothetical protein [Propionibacteriaceae bacterium]
MAYPVVYPEPVVVWVANQYKAAVQSQWSRVTPDLDDWRGLLDGVVGLLPQAWSGGSSDSVCQWLGDVRSSMQRCCDGCDDEFRYAFNGQPDLVESTAWQAHWSGSGGYRSLPVGA